MRHKHADLIIAWANGAEIECRNNISGNWLLIPSPNWHLSSQYRIKPEVKPDVEKLLVMKSHWALGIRLEEDPDIKADLKLTFDGESGKLKSAEVLAS